MPPRPSPPSNNNNSTHANVASSLTLSFVIVYNAYALRIATLAHVGRFRRLLLVALLQVAVTGNTLVVNLGADKTVLGNIEGKMRNTAELAACFRQRRRSPRQADGSVATLGVSTAARKSTADATRTTAGTTVAMPKVPANLASAAVASVAGVVAAAPWLPPSPSRRPQTRQDCATFDAFGFLTARENNRQRWALFGTRVKRCESA